MSRASRPTSTQVARPCWHRMVAGLASWAVAISACLLLSSCAQSVHSTSSAEGVPRFPETARGDARFAQWVLGNSGRKVRLVDVTATYPDPQQTVAGAIVLVDQRRVPYRSHDYTNRPVVVRYTSLRAAEAAMRGRDLRTFGRRGRTVLWIPPNLPSQVAAQYRFAGSAGLQ